MVHSRHLVFWLLVLASVLTALFMLHAVLLPFVAGLFLAYLLDPLADRLERLSVGRFRVGRAGATLLILLFFVVLLMAALVLLVPIVAHQLSAFISNLPAIVARLQTLAEEQGAPLLERLGGQDAVVQMRASIGGVVGEGASWLGGFLQSLWSSGQAIVSMFALLVVTPVVAFYLLVDWDHMIATVDRWLPRPNRDTLRGLAREVDRAMVGFIRGQSLVCLFLASFYAIGLSLAGLNFGVLIGIVSGVLSFIPYVGSLTGLVLSAGVAIVQFWPEWGRVLIVLGVFGLGQFIEGNILSPKLVGASVGLHPVWMIFALLAFGSLFGFLGLLVAVPLAAVTGVFIRFALRRYLLSDVYDPDQPDLNGFPVQSSLVRL